MELTQEIVHELFSYCDGQLIRKKTTSSRAIAGLPVGCIDKHGYRVVRIFGKLYKVHRLIFLFHYGYFPEIVDHIDCDQLNNRIENLRACNNQQNLCNRGKQENNTSGYKGVSLKKGGRWNAYIKLNGVRMNLGSFSSAEEAAATYAEAAQRYHGEFART